MKKQKKARTRPKGGVKFRELDLSAAAVELKGSIPEVKKALAQLDQAKIVRRDTLRFEFSV